MENYIPVTTVDPLELTRKSGDPSEMVLTPEQIALLDAAIRSPSISEPEPALHQSTLFPQPSNHGIETSSSAKSQSPREPREPPAVSHIQPQRQTPDTSQQQEKRHSASVFDPYLFGPQDNLTSIKPITWEPKKPANRYPLQQGEGLSSNQHREQNQGPATPKPYISGAGHNLLATNQFPREQRAGQLPPTGFFKAGAAVATAPRNAIPFPGTKRTYSNSGLKDIEQNDGNLMSKKVKKNQDVQNKGRHGDTDSEDRCRHDEQPTHMKVKKKQDGQKKRRHADADADSEDSDCHDEQPTQKKAKNIHHANDRAMPKQPMIFATPPKQIINDTTGDETIFAKPKLPSTHAASIKRREQAHGVQTTPPIHPDRQLVTPHKENTSDQHKSPRIQVARKAPASTKQEMPKSSNPMPMWHPPKATSSQASASQARISNSTRKSIGQFTPSQEATNAPYAPKLPTFPTPSKGASMNNYTPKVPNFPNVSRGSTQAPKPLGSSSASPYLRTSGSMLSHTSNSRQQTPTQTPASTGMPSPAREPSQGLSGGTGSDVPASPQQRLQTQQSSRQASQSQQQAQAQAQAARMPVDRCIVPLMNQALYKKNLPETWTGTDIDGLAHEMWQLAISKEQFWNHISVEVGLWNHGKLRMLAMASVMPTWWFLREQAVTVMKAKGWNVDDSFYTMQMDQYYQLCRHQDRLRTAGK